MAVTVKALSALDNFSSSAGYSTHFLDTSDGNPADSFQLHAVYPMMDSVAELAKWTVKKFTITTNADISSADLKWDSKCTLWPGINIDIEIRLKKPDASEVTLSTRTLTGSDSNFVSTGPSDVKSNFDADGEYELIIVYNDGTGNDNVTGEVLFDNIELLFADSSLADNDHRIILDSYTDSIGVTTRSLDTANGNPADSLKLASTAAAHGGGAGQIGNPTWEILNINVAASTGDLDSVKVTYHSKVITNSSSNDIVIGIEVVKPDTSVVLLASRTITAGATDGSFVETNETDVTSTFDADGNYQIRITHNDGSVEPGASNSFDCLYDNIGLTILGSGAAPAANIKKLSGISWANVKKASSIIEASIKKISGITAN